MATKNRKPLLGDAQMRQVVARELTGTARLLVAADEEDDPKFLQKVRSMKQEIAKLGPKKNKKLSQFDIEAIRPNATVEELVNALQKVINGSDKKSYDMVAGKVVMRDGKLSVTYNVVSGHFAEVTGDPKMKKRDFVKKHYEDLAHLIDEDMRSRGVIGTINFRKAKAMLDRAFLRWVEDTIDKGGKISEKAMDGIDEDDGGDDFGKMWDVTEKAEEEGYVLDGRYYVVASLKRKFTKQIIRR